MRQHRQQHSASRVAPPARRGAAAVEFAVVASLLLVPSLLGMFEIGRAVQARTILSDAARIGARTGIKAGATSANITSDVNTVLSDNNISTTGAVITIAVNGNSSMDASTANADDQISVQVQVPYGNVSWGIMNFLKSTTLESESVVMMRQAH
jgi:Flp pilus assembly protein TadG